MEAALKMGPSFNSSPKLNLNEFGHSNPQNAASPSSDYVFADQLLNFPNEEEEEEKTQNSPVSAPLQHESDGNSNSNHSSTNSSQYDFLFVSSTDFEDLEWLSHLVADSTQEQYSATVPSSVFSTQNDKPIHSQNETTCFVHESGSNLNTPFPTKPRTKRPKIPGRVWSFTDSISSPLLYSPPAKKPTDGFGRVQPSRRCTHCGVQKTPQWRAGPLGAKTLCNACGVRFKSGRLFPEYRPACSPTFSSGIHSNHHRKVLEMRRKKEAEKPPLGSGLVRRK